MIYPLNDFQRKHLSIIPETLDISHRTIKVDMDAKELVIEDYGEIELTDKQIDILLKGGVFLDE